MSSEHSIKDSSVSDNRRLQLIEDWQDLLDQDVSNIIVEKMDGFADEDCFFESPLSCNQPLEPASLQEKEIVFEQKYSEQTVESLNSQDLCRRNDEQHIHELFKGRQYIGCSSSVYPTPHNIVLVHESQFGELAQNVSEKLENSHPDLIQLFCHQLLLQINQVLDPADSQAVMLKLQYLRYEKKHKERLEKKHKKGSQQKQTRRLLEQGPKHAPG